MYNKPIPQSTYIRIKKYIKCNRNSKNKLIKWSIQSLYFIKKILSTTKKFIVNKEFRSLTCLTLFHSKDIHQTTPLTWMNRYPEIFSACKEYFKCKDDIRILSYGCSTGEEVLTLRHYFPNATIIGAEINPNSLNICKKLKVDENIHFIKSTYNEIAKQGKYDLIFCMAVFQRTPDKITNEGIKSLKNIYPFEKFEDQIVDLDKNLNKDGLFVTHFSQYYFNDTKISNKYEAFGNYNQDDYNRAIFDKNSNLITHPESRNSIFIKILD